MALRAEASTEFRTWKPVTCAFCGLDFAVRVSARGTGQADTHLFRGPDGAMSAARGKAIDSAARNLRRALPVQACPECGRYQQFMLGRVRAQKYAIVAVPAVLAIVVGAVGAVLTWVLAPLSEGIIPVLVGLAVAGVAANVVAFILQRRFDPNADAASRSQKITRGSETVMRRDEYELEEKRAQKSSSNRFGVAPLTWPESRALPAQLR
jgi:hypothetical protein